MDVNKQALVDAANYLVQVRDYVNQRRDLIEIINAWQDKRVYFAGERECLNALISLGLSGVEKLDALLQIVEQKRRALPDTKRTEYQREFMRTSRARMRKALALEEKLAGKPLTRSERTAREKHLRAMWNLARDKYVEARGVEDWEDKLEAIREFWAEVDSKLDAETLTPPGLKPRKRDRRAEDRRDSVLGTQ
jgi:hypothetical protein